MKYSYKGYMPNGAGETFYIDQYVDDDFNGNATERVIDDGAATFEIISEEVAVLHFNKTGEDLKFVKR